MTCNECGDRGYIVIGDNGWRCTCEAGGKLCRECMEPNDSATPFAMCRSCADEARCERAHELAR